MVAWNPSRTGSSIVLSNGGLTATHAAYFEVGNTQPDVGVGATGDGSWSITVGGIGNNPSWGIAPGSISLTDYPGDFDANGVSLHKNGNIYDPANGFAQKANLGGAIAVGDVLDFRVKGGKLYVRRNGGPWNGSQYAAQYAAADPTLDNGIPIPWTGTYFPTVSMDDGSSSVTASFAGLGSSTDAVSGATGVVSQTRVLGTPTASTGASGVSFGTPSTVTSQTRVLGTPTAGTAAPSTKVTVGVPVLGSPALYSPTYQFLAPPTVGVGTPVLGSPRPPYAIGAVSVVPSAPVLGSPSLAGVAAKVAWDVARGTDWTVAADGVTATLTAPPWGSLVMADTSRRRSDPEPGRYFTVQLTAVPTGGGFTIGLKGDRDYPDKGVGGNPSGPGVRKNGTLWAQDFNVQYGNFGDHVVGDVFKVRLAAGTAYFSKNGGAESAVPLAGFPYEDWWPAVFSDSPVSGMVADFSGWQIAAAPVGTIGTVTSQPPVLGLPTASSAAALSSSTQVASQSAMLGRPNASAFAQFQKWYVADEAGGPLTDENGNIIEDETRPATLVANTVQAGAPVLGAPAASTVAAGTYVVLGASVVPSAPVVAVAGGLATAGGVGAVGITTGAPILGTPGSGSLLFQFVAAGLETPAPTLASPLMSLVGSQFITPTTVTPASRVVAVATGLRFNHLVAGQSVQAQARVTGAGQLHQWHVVAAQGVSPSTPVIPRPVLLAVQAFYAVGVIRASRVLGLVRVSQVQRFAGVGIVRATRVLGAPLVSTRTVHDAIAGAVGVTRAAAILASPALRQRQAFASVGVAAGSPVVGVAARPVVRSRFTALGVVGSPRVLGSPAFALVSRVVALPVVALTRVLGRPAVRQAQRVIALPVVAKVPALAAPLVRQRLVFLGTSVAAGSPVVASPAVTITLKDFHVDGRGLVTGAPRFARPPVHSRHVVVGIGIIPGHPAATGHVRVTWTGLDGGRGDQPKPEFTGHSGSATFVGGSKNRARFRGRQRTGGMS